jgi:uncharacterized protein YxeA
MTKPTRLDYCQYLHKRSIQMKSVLRLVIVLIACTAVIGGVVLWRQHNLKRTVTVVAPETRDTNGKNTTQEITKSLGKDNASQKSDVAGVPSALVAEQTDDEHTGNIKESGAATAKKVKSKIMSKRAAEKAMRDEARKKRWAALEAENAEIDKLVEDTLRRSEIFESILFPIFKGDRIPSEAERKAMVNQVAPIFVEQLNTLSADEQYEFLKDILPMTGSVPEDTNDEMESAKHTLLQILQKHGFEKKF